MSHDLFRKEVLEARRTSFLGSISLAQPLRLWVLTAFAAGAAIVVGLFLALGTYTRRSSVTGQLVPTRGLATVLAPVTGVVDALETTEGNRVRSGQRLAVVSAPRATLGNGDTHAALQQRLQQKQDGLQSGHAAQLRQFTAQSDGLRQQLATTRRELAQIEREVATRREQVEIYDQITQRMEALRNQQYVSALELEQYQAARLEYASEMQILQRQAITTRRSIAQLQQALRELPTQRQASEAGYHGELAQLEQERLQTEANGALAIIAPVTGTVATQMVKPGQAVQAGQALMSLLPGNGALEAELLVPSRAIGFIEPGDTVLLRYQAYPYQKFGHQRGTVATISRSALSTGELGALIGNAQQGEPYYRVTVALARQAITAYGKPEPLKPGMLLDADILGEKRRLIEWIFEPLYSLKGQVGNG